MTTDPKGIISDVNQQMMALTGQTRDDLIGAPCKNFFTDPDRAEAAIQRVLTENKLSDYELTVRSKTGEETVVSYNAATIHDRDNNLVGVFAAARDITDRQRFERTLQQKNIELEHATRMKSEFLATMSHELRTPLNAIIGFSEALKDGLVGEMAESQHEYIGDIFTSGQHLLSLINDILDLSKVEAGMMALELEVVELGDLLSNSLSIVRKRAAAQQISLELEAPGDLGSPLLDMRKTKQIMYNLLSNAVKFSGQGGGIMVSARRVPRSYVGRLDGAWPVHNFPTPQNEYGEFIEITVTDSGIGISKDDMAKLFQAFSQIDSSLSRKFAGTGLGLAMVKELAELHGGSVAVASAAGEGSRFAVWLPLRAPLKPVETHKEVPHHIAVATEVTRPEQRVALMVEDDDRAAELVRLLLEGEGFDVIRANSAEMALEVAPRQHLSLITLDVQLPGKDGWEFLALIRRDPALASVPVVIIAGDVDAHVALAGGAAAALQKPVSRAQLKLSLANLGLNAGGQARTILVVDDDPKAVEVIAGFLPTPAYAVVRAYGGGEAIILAQRLHPDLILLDLVMPDVSGFDVIEALQRNTDTASIPVLVVTAKQLTPHDQAALYHETGKVVQSVDKAGFNRESFLAEVRRALSAQLEVA
jgi:PAS domain S-box-containing protein